MATTILGSSITFNNGTSQDTGTYIGLDTNSGGVNTVCATNYSVGHYMLIENNSYGSYSIAVPLNGWDNSTYSSPVVINGISFSTPAFSGTCTYWQYTSSQSWIFSRSNVNLGGNAFQATGTWKNRGGNLSVFLVQRVA